MDDVVAVEIRLADGSSRYFMTWGRIQHTVDPQALCDLVLQASRSFSLGGEPISARICTTMREAAESPNAPYFYECYLSFCHKPAPRGDTYQAWRDATDTAMRAGHEVAYCGQAQQPSSGTAIRRPRVIGTNQSRGMTPIRTCMTVGRVLVTG